MLQTKVINCEKDRVQVNERQHPISKRSVTRDRGVRSSNHRRRPRLCRQRPSSFFASLSASFGLSIPQLFETEASTMPATRIQVFRDPTTVAALSGPSMPRRRTAPALGSKGPSTRSCTVEVSSPFIQLLNDWQLQKKISAFTRLLFCIFIHMNEPIRQPDISDH